jgi:hypothetical protein
MSIGLDKQCLKARATTGAALRIESARAMPGSYGRNDEHTFFSF